MHIAQCIQTIELINIKFIQKLEVKHVQEMDNQNATRTNVNEVLI